MSRRIAWTLVGLLVVALFVGTQMPNAWRNEVQDSVHAPFPLSSWAHFVLFTCLALVLSIRPLAWPVSRIVLLALALALLSEGLQFFAIDRHPRWIDVAIDLAGTFLGLMLFATARARQPAVNQEQGQGR